MKSLMQKKLFELLDAVESILQQDDAERWLDPNTIDQLSNMEVFVRTWLQDESTLTEEERVAVLANLTDALKPRIMASGSIKNTLH